jgi:hypothetical protein
MIYTFSPYEDMRRWLAWRAEVRGGRNAAPTKVPYAAGDGNYGSSTNPETWGTRLDAEGRAKDLDDGRPVGIGIPLGDLGDGFCLCGADLDSCLGEDGALAGWAAPALNLLKTYAEISPSGHGLKAFFLVATAEVRRFLDLVGIPATGWGTRRGIPGLASGNHGAAFEIYCGERYFTVTERLWNVDCQRIEVIDWERLTILAALIPPAPVYTANAAPGDAARPNTGGADGSRSARAASAAIRLQPDTYEAMCSGLRNHDDPEIQAWVEEKGEAADGRELRRIWDRLVATRAAERAAYLNSLGTGEHDSADTRQTAEDVDSRTDRPQISNDDADTAQPKQSRQRRYRFQLVRFKDIKLNTTPRWIVEDMIPRDGLVLMWGKPKCGKSFVAFDLGLHVALGWDYCGKRVEQGPVVYIAAEGALGLSARAEAFRQAKLAETDDADPPFHLLASRLDLVGQLDELVADTAAQLDGSDRKCAVIFLDTLNRTFRGSESRDEDMGNYLRAADRLREVFGCTVVLIHHCGYDDTRPRGHTSLIGALDAEISIKRDDDNTILAKLELMKDGASGDMLRFVLKPIDIGEDDYGKPLSSCFVEALDVPSTPRERKRKLSPTNQRALDLLYEAINTAGGIPPASNHIPPGRACARDKLWREYCYKGGLSDGTCDGAQQKAFKRAWNELLATKHVATWDGWVWPA